MSDFERLNELADAVELSVNPEVSQSIRLEALNACERFKETSNRCPEAGFYLTTMSARSPIVHHFGLQLVEHTIKYRWNQIAQPEKIFIKENSLKIISNCECDESYIKDAISRIFVEMIKREWPQQWPSMLSELATVCGCGNVQTQIVLLIFLRLVEDVAVLQTIESNQRRRDISQSLTNEMAVIFTFFMQLMEKHVQAFHEENSDSSKQKSDGRVVLAVLQTLSGFVEWVSYHHLLFENGRLIQMLFLLLTHQDFQVSAADCLLLIVNRKGKPEERKALYNEVFATNSMNCLMRAVKVSEPLTEVSFLFLKKYCQILIGYGQILTSVWGKEGGHYSHFLECVLEVSKYEIIVLEHSLVPLWISLFKHESLCRDQTLVSIVPKWLEIMVPKFVKREVTAGSRFEYDCDDISDMFVRFRALLAESVRAVSLVAPLVTFAYAEQWLTRCLQKKTDLSLAELEATSLFLDNCLSRILQSNERPAIADGLNLLERCLMYETADWRVASSILSCISSLFVFLSMASGQMAPAINLSATASAALLTKVLDRLFGVFLIRCDASNSATNGESSLNGLKSYRQHAAALLVNLSLNYPLLLLPLFNQIRSTIVNLSLELKINPLGVTEQVLLQEALILISNHVCDYDKQTKFIEELLHDTTLQWLTFCQMCVFKSTADFVEVMQLKQRTVDSSNAFYDIRFKLRFCIALVSCAVKRSAAPDDPERAQRGGFVVGTTDSGNPVCRNPATPHVVPVLPHLLNLMRIVHELHDPEVQRQLACGLETMLAISDAEKMSVLSAFGVTCVQGASAGLSKTANRPNSITQSADELETIEKIQKFFFWLIDNCYRLLGNFGPSLGRDFYQLDGLASAVISSLFSNLQHLPSIRVRLLIRTFLKSFSQSCPPSFNSAVLSPIISHICPIILTYLIRKWQEVCEKRTNATNDTELEAEELLEDYVTRCITREYLDVLKIVLLGSSINEAAAQDFEELSMDGPPATPSRASLSNKVVSDLGSMLLRTDGVRQSILFAVLGSLSWIDSTACAKATMLLGPIVKLLVNDATLTSEMALHVTRSVIEALAVHGQHDVNQGPLLTIGTQMYELLKPLHPEIMTIIQQIPGVNPIDVQKLDERIATPANKCNKVEKLKKDTFKKIISPLIGKNVSELFRKQVVLEDLPRIPNQKTQNYSITTETNLTNLFC